MHLKSSANQYGAMIWFINLDEDISYLSLFIIALAFFSILSDIFLNENEPGTIETFPLNDPSACNVYISCLTSSVAHFRCTPCKVTYEKKNEATTHSSLKTSFFCVDRLILAQRLSFNGVSCWGRAGKARRDIGYV